MISKYCTRRLHYSTSFTNANVSRVVVQLPPNSFTQKYIFMSVVVRVFSAYLVYATIFCYNLS